MCIYQWRQALSDERAQLLHPHVNSDHGISAQCFTQPTSKSGKSYRGEQSDKVDSAPVVHARIFLLPPEATTDQRLLR